MADRRDPDHGPEDLKEKLAYFERIFRSAGLRVTHQRMEIFRELAMATDHPSAETLHRRMKRTMPTLSVDTIYRALSAFEAHNLVTRVRTVENQARFEAQMQPHHHLICSKCKDIIDFQWEGFDDADLPEAISHWGEILGKSVTLHGVCRRCLAPGMERLPGVSSKNS